MFFRTCQSPSYQVLTLPFFFSALPPPSRNPGHKATFERLMAVPVEERSIQFLLTDEFLHRFGLLHSSRFTQPREVSNFPAQTSDAPTSTEEMALKEPTADTALVKCSSSIDVAGSSSKLILSPVIEEEENPRISEEKADVEVEKESSVGHHGDDTFDNLSDIMITSQELFKDDISKAISPVVEATSSLQQFLTPSTPVVAVSTLKRCL